ncbi:hypothetical protein C8R44DRAFT_655501 [Mycena epipterygia]|nr:hypothetical protein C8R44DRAFT_655501 [Mycena epipterygia]
MSDAEKDQFHWEKVTDSGDEAAAAKLWAVYISEAEKYDRALVESWKSDMEGMLIFAGLFSASLTAFIIESYKTLNPDSGDTTINLLSQISQQLAASANGTTFRMQPAAPFIPSTASLVCNGLWFVSLGLSLSCALIATLLEQWARDFLHKADMRSAPPIRARVFSFLYYGLKRFQMHTVVEIIPLLLHASLLFFFAGLVAFLVPVNFTMTVIASALLLIVAAAYSVLTLLPLWYLDCPYRTPLSGVFWRPVQTLKTLWQHPHTPSDATGDEQPPLQEKSMVEAMFRTATERSEEQLARDYKALVWTMKSLADDQELEPFVEAIPDVLWGPKARRYTYEDQIRRLLNNPDVELQSRIQHLFDSCKTGILSVKDSKRRRIACCKALWVIASLCGTRSVWRSKNRKALDFGGFINLQQGPFSRYHSLQQEDPEVLQYLISAKAQMIWCTFCAVQDDLISLQRDISRRENADLNLVKFSLENLRLKFYHTGVGGVLDQLPSMPLQLATLRSIIDKFLLETPYQILFQYLSESARLTSPPYRWTETQGGIQLEPLVELSSFQEEIEGHLHDIIFHQADSLNIFPDVTELTWIDTSVSILLSFWQPDYHVAIPRAVIQFLNQRYSDLALDHILCQGKGVESNLWSNFPATLLNGPSAPLFPIMPPLAREDVFTALWRLAHFQSYSTISSVHFKAILDALSNADSSFAYLCHSIAFLVKQRMLTNNTPHYVGGPGGDLPTPILKHPGLVLAEKTTVDVMVSEDQYDILEQSLHIGTTEARINLLTEFLEHCSSDVLPYKVVETVQTFDCPPPTKPIHHTHQIRLANSIHGAFLARNSPDLLNAIITANCFDLYAQAPRRGWTPWLEDPSARTKIKNAFADYEKTLMLSADSSPAIRTRLRMILEALDHLHPQSDPSGGSEPQGAGVEQ